MLLNVLACVGAITLLDRAEEPKEIAIASIFLSLSLGMLLNKEFNDSKRGSDALA